MAGSSLLIFIIDDDVPAMQTLKHFVERKYSDVTVVTFSSAEEALVELHQKPEIIILDYHLKNAAQELNGIEVLKRIKELLPHTPVIFISDDDHEKVASNIIRYGAYDYIVRGPGAYNRLEIMINNATGHYSLRKQLKVQRTFNIILMILILLAFVAIFLGRFW